VVVRVDVVSALSRDRDNRFWTRPAAAGDIDDDDDADGSLVKVVESALIFNPAVVRFNDDIDVDVDGVGDVLLPRLTVNDRDRPRGSEYWGGQKPASGPT
jgi:hypothetical protein